MGSIGAGKTAANEISQEVLNEAVAHAEGFQGAVIDKDNQKIIIPFPKSMTEDILMQEGMLGNWYSSHGFDISFTVGDFEYTTKDSWNNYRAMTRHKGHKAFLRNRTIATITWVK